MNLRQGGIFNHAPAIGVRHGKGRGGDGREAPYDGIGVLAGAEERIDPVLVSKVPVDFIGGAVVVDLVGQRRQVIVGNRTVGWRREVRLERLRNLGDAAGGDGVVGEGRPHGGSGGAGGIVNHLRKGAEIARTLGRGGNGLVPGRSGRDETVSIVVAVEKQLVLLDGAADAGAEFVLVLDRRSRREEASGIEIRVPEVFEYAPVELVGSRFEDVIRHPLPLVRRLGAGGLHLKLVHRLHRNAERQVAGVALRPGAGQGQTLDVHLVLVGLAAIEGSGRGTGRLRTVVVDANRQAGKRRRIPRGSVHGQRKGVVNQVIHRGAQRHIVRLQDGRLLFHGDRLAGGPDLQFRIYADRGQRLHDHMRLGIRLKTGCRDRKRVVAGGKQRNHEETRIRGLANRFRSGRGTGGGHRGGRNHRSRWICDCAFYGTCPADLGESRKGGGKQRKAASNMAHGNLLCAFRREPPDGA